jgi:hypothetical protein
MLLMSFGMSNISYAQIEMNNLGIGVSYWQRTYPNLSENVFLVNYQHDPNFRLTAPMFSLSCEVGLYKDFAVEGSMGYWRGIFESHALLSDNFRISERMDQIVFPGFIGLVYNWRDMVKNYLNGYSGVGVSRYFIRNSFSRLVEDGSGDIAGDVEFGNDYGVVAKLGLEYLFPEFFSLAIEGRYHYGAYRQLANPKNGEEAFKRKIDLKGFEVGIFFRYNFSY